MAVKLKLLTTYYRALVDGAHRTIHQGETFETDEANAARLVKAGAAEPVKAAVEPKGEDPSPPVDPGDKTKPTPKAGAK